MRGQYVLENKLGQVVRVFELDAKEFSLVYLQDSRRVEAVANTADLDKEKIPYTELLKTDAKEAKNSPLAVGKIGTFRWTENIEKLSPTVATDEDDPRQFKTALKWVAGVQLALLLLLLLIGHFIDVDGHKEAPTVVTIVPRPQPEKPQPRRREIVEVTETKVEHKNVTHKVTPHKVTKLARVRPTPHKATKSLAPNNTGVAEMFGALEKSNQQGGVKLNTMKTSRGVGLGGTEGSGGVQTSLYGAGLIAAPLGPQGKATGAGGYGTKGKGGGEAGYGRMSLVGSSNAYFQPVEQEASVEGGLDREEIAAVIQRHLGQIRNCYEQGLQVKPGLNGRVAIRFFINARGIVSTANVANTSLHSAGVESCITSHLKSWKFPEPRGGVIVKVTYPFVLKRVSQS